MIDCAGGFISKSMLVLSLRVLPLYLPLLAVIFAYSGFRAETVYDTRLIFGERSSLMPLAINATAPYYGLGSAVPLLADKKNVMQFKDSIPSSAIRVIVEVDNNVSRNFSHDSMFEFSVNSRRGGSFTSAMTEVGSSHDQASRPDVDHNCMVMQHEGFDRAKEELFYRTPRPLPLYLLRTIRELLKTKTFSSSREMVSCRFEFPDILAPERPEFKLSDPARSISIRGVAFSAAPSSSPQ